MSDSPEVLGDEQLIEASLMDVRRVMEKPIGSDVNQYLPFSRKSCNRIVEGVRFREGGGFHRLLQDLTLELHRRVAVVSIEGLRGVGKDTLQQDLAHEITDKHGKLTDMVKLAGFLNQPSEREMVGFKPGRGDERPRDERRPAGPRAGDRENDQGPRAEGPASHRRGRGAGVGQAARRPAGGHPRGPGQKSWHFDSSGKLPVRRSNQEVEDVRR